MLKCSWNINGIFFLFLGCQTESVTLNELCFVVQSIDGVILIYVS